MILIKKRLYTTLKLSFIFILSIFLLIVGLYLYAYLSPKINIKTNGNFFIYDQNIDLVYQGSSSSEWVDIKNINQNMINAMISIEDKRFYKHKGFDYLRICSAILNNIKSNSLVEGASTISQQYVKNLYLSFEKTWKRKIEEAMLTMELEMHYKKEDILEGYLNTIYFGEGNYGIQNAANYYFNKDAKDLSLIESCFLAGIPKSPSNYNPVSNYDNAKRRANIVAKSMLKNNMIDNKEYKKIIDSNISIYGKREKNNLKTLMYYQDAVLSELKTLPNIPKSLINSGGLKIYTGLDINKQTILENAINENMKNDDTQVASIYINPTNGLVEALIGGRDYSKSQFNRVTSSNRQVGSTIKPFLYYSALSNGLTMASTFKSEKTTFSLSDNKTYSPGNYNELYANKDITMAAALAFSDNIYAVKTHLFLGSDNLVDTMKLFNLKKKLPNIPSLALGTAEINMLDYASSYNCLASGGYNHKIHLINKVEDLDGNIIYEYRDKNEMILNYNYVFIINQMLTYTYNTNFIDYNIPTAIGIKGRLSKDYSIKTGTTDNDNWIIGYNPEALLMVWTGKDKNEKKTVGYSKITKNIWADAMENSLKDKENKWYIKPNNVIGIPLSPIDGSFDYKSKKEIFYFLKGTEPKYYIKSKKLS